MPKAFLIKKSVSPDDFCSMDTTSEKPARMREIRCHPAHIPYFPSPNTPWPPIGLPTAASQAEVIPLHLRQPLAPKNPESSWINNNYLPYSSTFLSVSQNPAIWTSASSPFHSFHANLPPASHLIAPLLSRQNLPRPRPICTAFDIDTILGNPCIVKPDRAETGKVWVDEELMEVDNNSEQRTVRRSTPRYQCPECKKSYSTMAGLTKHREFHCTVIHRQSFKCKFCDKMYGTVGALKMHMRTHTLPNQCTVCGRRFSRPWLLQGHMRTHSGDKPFQCTECHRPFADRSNLRAHLQTHAEIKKYKCEICLKTFSRMSLLNKHQTGSCRLTSLQSTEGTLV